MAVSQTQEEIAKELTLTVVSRVALSSTPDEAAAEVAKIYKSMVTNVYAAYESTIKKL